MAQLDINEFRPLLKRLYPGNTHLDLAYTNHVMLGMFNKDNNFQGEAIKIPVMTSRPQNRSATFAKAKGTGGGGKTSKQQFFLIDTVENYNFGFVDNKTIQVSKGNKGAVTAALQHETDQAIKALARNLNIDLFGNGSGQIGQRASLSTDTVTLSNVQDVVKFENGMTLVASPNADGSSPRAGSADVVAVDRDAGTVTLDSAAGITSFADNDYLFVDGDIGEKLKGLDAWIPATAPTSSPFFGLDRSVDPTRLGGVRFSGTNLTHREALIKCAARVHREGGMPDYVVMNTDDYAELSAELDSDIVYDKAIAQYYKMDKERASISYEAIVLNTPHGKMKILADRDCPVGVAYMLQMDTWTLHSVGDIVSIFNTDGLPFLRASDFDGVEIRVHSYPQLSCDAPGKNARLTLPALSA